MAGAKGSTQSKAFSSEVDTGSRKENASRLRIQMVKGRLSRPGRAIVQRDPPSFPVETAGAAP
jgi:hypothetical protein